jgi:hypothetical protein
MLPRVDCICVLSVSMLPRVDCICVPSVSMLPRVECICVPSVSMLPLHLRFSFAFFLVFLIVENVVNKQLKYLY